MFSDYSFLVQSGSTKSSPSKPSDPKLQKLKAEDEGASGKSQKHIAHKPKKGGDGSRLYADKDISKPDGPRASKSGKPLTSAAGSVGDGKKPVKGDEEQPEGKGYFSLMFFT